MKHFPKMHYLQHFTKAKENINVENFGNTDIISLTMNTVPGSNTYKYKAN